jgi:hypothetical protein
MARRHRRRAASRRSASSPGAHHPRSTKASPTGKRGIKAYGVEATSAQRARALVALRAYLEARAHREWSRACSYLAPPLRRQALALTAGSAARSCAAAYAVLYGHGPASALADPLSGGLLAFRIHGRRGVAAFRAPAGTGYVMPMVSEAGSWRVTQLAPVSYPPASSP